VDQYIKFVLLLKFFFKTAKTPSTATIRLLLFVFHSLAMNPYPRRFPFRLMPDIFDWNSCKQVS